jgi:hypothetical protein
MILFTDNVTLTFFPFKADNPFGQFRKCVQYPPYSHIYTYDGKNVAEYVRLGDGPVNVRDHDLVCVMPQVDVTPATGKGQQRLNVTATDKYCPSLFMIYIYLLFLSSSLVFFYAMRKPC